MYELLYFQAIHENVGKGPDQSDLRPVSKNMISFMVGIGKKMSSIEFRYLMSSLYPSLIIAVKLFKTIEGS